MLQRKMAGCICKGNDELSEMYFTKFSRNSQDQFQDQGCETPLKTWYKLNDLPWMRNSHVIYQLWNFIFSRLEWVGLSISFGKDSVFKAMVIFVCGSFCWGLWILQRTRWIRSNYDDVVESQGLKGLGIRHLRSTEVASDVRGHPFGRSPGCTPPKFNMEPEKWWFPRGCSFSRDFFSGSSLNFRGVLIPGKNSENSPTFS